MTIAPGKVSLFWPNESCTKRCIHSSNPEDTGYIATMAKTGQNYVNCVHVTLTYTSSNCILPEHGYTTDSFPKESGSCETTTDVTLSSTSSSSTIEPPTNSSTLSSTPFATLPVSTAANLPSTSSSSTASLYYFFLFFSFPLS